MRHFSGDLQGLRLLMEDELELVAGGDGEDTDDNTVAEVTVYGESPSDPGSGWTVFIGVGSGGYGSSNDCAGTGAGPSAAGNAFAAAHINLTGDLNDAKVAAAYASTHNALAALHDLAQNFPSQVIHEPNGASMTAAQMYAQLSNATINIGPSAMAPHGADTYNSGSGAVNVYIDPSNANVNGAAGSLGLDANSNYIIFHELGHVMQDSWSQGNVNPAQREAIANRECADLAAAGGLAYPSDAYLAGRGGVVSN